MGSHSKKRIFLLFVVCQLCVGGASAAEDLIIRGDQSESLLHQVPPPVKMPPSWIFEDAQTDADELLKKLLADIEFFTREPETEADSQRVNTNQITTKPISTPANGASP